MEPVQKNIIDNPNPSTSTERSGILNGRKYTAIKSDFSFTLPSVTEVSQDYQVEPSSTRDSRPVAVAVEEESGQGVIGEIAGYIFSPEDLSKIEADVASASLASNDLLLLNVKQSVITPHLLSYLRMRNPELWVEEGQLSEEILVGVCHGLTSLYCYYQFLGKEVDFFKRIGKALSTNFDPSKTLADTPYNLLTKDEKELEHLCNDIIYLQKPLMEGGQVSPANQLSFMSGKEIKSFSSRCYFTATFSQDKETGEFKSLVKALGIILASDSQKQKFIFISTGNHAIGIFYKEGQCFFYDPNNPSLPHPIDISDSNQEQGVQELIQGFEDSTFPGQNSIMLEMSIISQDELPEINDIELYSKVPINIKPDSRGFTPLVMAVRHGDVKAIKALISLGADINLTDRNGYTPLTMAVKYDNVEAIEALFDQRVNIDLVDDNGFTPLVMAVQYGNVKAIKALLRLKADVNLHDRNGFTPLTMAVNKGHLKVMVDLIAEGADVNLRDKNKYTPLVLALYKLDVNAIKFLINQGSDINLRDKKGRTELFRAAEKNNVVLIKALLILKADINLRDNKGRTALLRAVEKGNVDAINTLINLRDKHGRTLLFQAARAGDVSLIKNLIKLKADGNICDNKGITPIAIALKYGHKVAATVLRLEKLKP